MLIVGPPLQPGSAEEYALRITGPMDMVRQSVVMWIRDAMREEAKQCAADVCVHCRASAISWLTSATFHTEMQQFYHMLKDDPTRVGAQCDARGIWMRLYNQKIAAELERDRLRGQVAGVSIGGGAAQPLLPWAAVAQHTAAAPGIVPGSVKDFKLETCPDCCGGGKHKHLMNAKCVNCNGNGQVLSEQ